jgi:hypothetical protein
MGIQLTDFQKHLIKQVASFMENDINVSGYLFGYQTARLEQFLTGVITKQQLADDHAMVELVRTLTARYCPTHLREIADGTRELPGEDVPSGQ